MVSRSHFHIADPACHDGPSKTSLACDLLLPVIGPFDPIPAQVDSVLTAAARLAKAGNAETRNRLFLAFQPKLSQISRQIRFWMLPVTWEREDLEQEIFLVFVDLLDAWSGDLPFTGYLLGHFSWRLRGTVRRARQAERLPVGAFDASASLPDDSWAAEELRILLEEVAAHFSSLERAILLGRVCDGEGFGALAHRLGVSRKTVYRHWIAILAELRASLGVNTSYPKSLSTRATDEFRVPQPQRRIRRYHNGR